MDLFRGIIFLISWILIVNAAWVVVLAAYHPDRFSILYRDTRDFSPDRKYSPLRSKSHLLGAGLAFFIAGLVIFDLAFSFIPNSWGSVDEYGDFYPLSQSLAGFISLPLAIVLFRLMEHTGLREESLETAQLESQARIEELEFNLNEVTERLNKSNDYYYETSHQMDLQRIINEEILNKEIIENSKLKSELLEIRKLVPEKTLKDYDEMKAQRAIAKTRTYYS
ncbi:hypothetical protein [Stappia indica]|uniref:hypothetical protein n=1 Tax=Stappia indica TaxID=538381 RepID=UPI001CD1A2FA|nr:hypothetical protein [Stappia indica]MCA1299612.1 hypothetical protein [Stappia indica]